MGLSILTNHTFWTGQILSMSFYTLSSNSPNTLQARLIDHGMPVPAWLRLLPEPQEAEEAFTSRRTLQLGYPRIKAYTRIAGP